MKLYIEIDDYLSSLDDNILKFDEFKSSLSKIVINEYKLDPNEDNDKNIEQILRNLLFSLLKQKKMLILFNNTSLNYHIFDSEEAKIIFLFEKFGYQITRQDNTYSISRRDLEALFKIYENIITKDAFKRLENRAFINKYDDGFYITITSTIVCNSSYDTKIMLEVIEKNLNLEYLMKYSKDINKLTENLSKAEKIIKKLNNKNKILMKKYENSTLYSISTMGIFLAIFSLISINSTFIYEIMKNESLTSKAGLILLVNGVLLTGLISLVTLIKSLFEVNSDQNIFSKLGGKTIIIPVVLCVLGLLFIA